MLDQRWGTNHVRPAKGLALIVFAERVGISAATLFAANAV